MTGPLPHHARDLIDALLDCGWSVQVLHQSDMGDHPFVTIEGTRGRRSDSVERPRVTATWHTRGTGTYRYMHGLIGGRRDATVAALIAYIIKETP